MDALLAAPEAEALKARFGVSAVKRALAAALEEARPAWLAGGPAPAPGALLRAAAAELGESFGGVLRRVINGTGVVLHTNLGRAPLPPAALDQLTALLSGYVDLEVDLGSRARGHRDARLERSLQEWLDTDRSVIAVNNNAAAVLLMLSTLSSGRETVVSRGELVEIGGGFRVPEVMAASGARLREVGTTNRTRLSDFRRAAGPHTGLLLKVHPSNYRVVGFTEEVPLADLVALGRELGVPVGYDWGTGLATEGSPLGLAREETLREALAAGPDVLTFSTDKLFGACQGGLLLVAPAMAEAFRGNPLLRALRVDKVTYALLGATLDLYRRDRTEALPALAMLSSPERTLRARAHRLKRDLERRAPGRYSAEVVDAEGRAGGGSAPLSPLPSPALALAPEGGRAEDLESYLRTGGEPPVLGVLNEGRLLIHVRTLLPGEASVLLDRLSGYGRRP